MNEVRNINPDRLLKEIRITLTPSQIGFLIPIGLLFLIGLSILIGFLILIGLFNPNRLLRNLLYFKDPNE